MAIRDRFMAFEAENRVEDRLKTRFGESLEAVGLTREEAMALAEEARAGSSTWAGSLLGSGEMLRTSDRKERVLLLVNL